MALGARAWMVAIEFWCVIAAELMGQLVVVELLQLGSGMGSLWNGEATPFLIVGTLLAQPLIALVRLAAYLDVRTRREGLDAWFALWTAANRPGIA